MRHFLRLTRRFTLSKGGQSVETLVSTYVGALDDEEQVGNQRIESILTLPSGAGLGRSSLSPT